MRVITLCTYESQYFTFQMFFDVKLTYAQAKPHFKHALALHGKQYKHADIEGMQQDIENEEFSLQYMKTGHVYRDGVEL